MDVKASTMVQPFGLKPDCPQDFYGERKARSTGGLEEEREPA